MPHPLAGQPVPPGDLVDIPRLISDYYTLHPDPTIPEERISFGTSGHRGSALKRSFNEDHILAVTQAVCDYRKEQKIDGPLFLGRDTHALSLPAFRTALEVLAANDVEVHIAGEEEYTPTPLVSRAILQHEETQGQKADGIVITPSHNPPEDGGFKYNGPDGGPADTHITAWIEERANDYLSRKLEGVRRLDFEEVLASESVAVYDFVGEYVKRLGEIVDMEAIKKAGIRIGADPLGGSALPVYQAIRDYWGIDLTLLNPRVDPTFSFMRLDHDGRIRMDCSSPWVMKGLEEHKGEYDLIVANDTDADRHGIVTRSGGLMNPNHYLSVAVGYLSEYRGWEPEKMIGKTLVSSSMIDRVAESFGRKVYEVPVGFKWFVPGLISGELCYGGEESAGASFLRYDGRAWSTDKDGLIMTMLAAEIMAVTGKDPAEIYREYEKRFGRAYYRRIDAPADRELKARLKALDPKDITDKELAGEAIEAIYTRAPGNDAPIGGLKIVTAHGWVAMRPSGTEEIYKIYAESFLSEEHLERLLAEAQSIVDRLKD
ncbi:phosphoglucomutase (alpha-D-glucose-1,6-bisphosphate-dependent) [Nitratifractor salsuginis]|uniref:Phosphoglucomutase, alpha-D-glucose phosphate-specific n=1 Tax=Nitratifractor salsuginis (strain DSM 16511 / JCM 12458 / E9I37-1) TaxID=749222 RepID=E6X3I7_NITSE|nr:phosphoglucomutase (alpha-D-glucose-1,6-bisphosphate-dependent) [Nitratifractor salsuginis]ADV46264.1 phosphoglucomutase, alpha-D-glucose phosphate-specific [Nitratifractor salsuginis DSM 16511]